MILLLLPLLSIILMGFGFGVYSLGWLVLLALVPLFFFIKLAAAQGWSRKRILLVVTITGFIFNLYNLSWMWAIQPGVWGNIPGPAVFGVQLGVWLLGSIFFTTGFALFGLLLLWLPDLSLSSWQTLIILPSMWVVGEYIRSWVDTILCWGRGASFSPNWNFGALGFGLSGTPLMYLSRFVGLYGLSFVVVAVNILVFWLLQKRYKPFVIIMPIILLISLLSYLGFRETNKQLKVGLLGITADSTEYHEMLLNHIQNHPTSDFPVDVLVLPESPAFYTANDGATTTAILNTVLKPDTGLTIAGGEKGSDGSNANKILYRKADGTVIAEQEKNLLTPVGEFMPAALSGLFWLTGHEELKTQYEYHHIFQKGRLPEQPVAYQGTVYGTLACSGIISPIPYRRLTSQGAEVLVNSANMSFLGTDSGRGIMLPQLKQMSVFQAVANARPLVQSTNSGRNLAVSSDGQILVDQTKPQVDIISTVVHPGRAKTLYVLLGEWVVLVSFGILVYYFGYKPRRKRKTPRKQKPAVNRPRVLDLREQPSSDQ